MSLSKDPRVQSVVGLNLMGFFLVLHWLDVMLTGRVPKTVTDVFGEPSISGVHTVKLDTTSYWIYVIFFGFASAVVFVLWYFQLKSVIERSRRPKSTVRVKNGRSTIRIKDPES